MFERMIGVEIELNSLDNRDFIKNPLSRGEMPLGIDHISDLVSSIGLESEVHGWQYNHGNKKWCCKPDSSCGIEVCSPVLRFSELDQIFDVLDLLAKENNITIDDRCSFHVHVDLSFDEIASVLAWWVKCEHVFMDFAIPHRKNNRYCKSIGLTSLFNSDDLIVPIVLIKKMSDKYLTTNSFHFFNKKRNSIEFRLAEGTKNSEFASNWIALIFCFLDACKESGIPEDYRWLDANQVLDFIFKNATASLKKWFLERLLLNCLSGSSFPFDPNTRRHAFNEYIDVYRKCFGEIP